MPSKRKEISFSVTYRNGTRGLHKLLSEFLSLSLVGAGFLRQGLTSAKYQPKYRPNMFKEPLGKPRLWILYQPKCRPSVIKEPLGKPRLWILLNSFQQCVLFMPNGIRMELQLVPRFCSHQR